MAYLLNNVNLNTYGITAGHAEGSNIAMAGVFDLPARTGKCFHEWGDEHSIEPYVASGEISFAGRDIMFTGSILGSVPELNSNLKSFYDAVNAATGISVLETPYHSASGYVKSVIPEYMNGGARVIMTFREPVVDLTGVLPASGVSSYTIDNIPFISFGLYLSKAEALHDLPELKEQFFTKYGSEGYQIVKRKNRTLDFNGFVVGASLLDFQSKISTLYKLFSSAGTKSMILSNEKKAICFAVEGFKVNNVHFNGQVIANIRMSLLCESTSNIYADYFLPSYFGVSSMYTELFLNAVGGFTSGTYLSSSEADEYSADAVEFSSGEYSQPEKSTACRVRACRFFSSLVNYNLRDIGPAGGYIFWKSGNDYLEAAPADQSASHSWSNIVNQSVGATSTAIGAGQSNTTKIINQSGHTDSAAKLCEDLVITV